MNFEEVLRAELSLIDSLTDKVFPLNATEGTEAPYIIYVSSEGLFDKSFEGYLNSKEVNCEINILVSNYSNLKALSKLVIAKIISFQGRIIGQNGPLIKNVTYEISPEIYEKEVSLYRSVIDLKVKF